MCSCRSLDTNVFVKCVLRAGGRGVIEVPVITHSQAHLLLKIFRSRSHTTSGGRQRAASYTRSTLDYVAMTTRVGVVDALRGAHGRHVSVVETEHHRMLLSGTAVLGIEYTDDRFRWQAPLAAMALMQVVAFLAPAVPRRSLCLGLGAGTVPHFLRASGIHTDAVEIDAAVIDMAKTHFEFGRDRRASPGDARVIHADAVQYVVGTEPHDKYDVILSDLWSGANAASTLQLPFMSRLRSEWLRPHGQS